jgi:3'-phosphoadenosine 5'-phosphosulfate sulfotransferase (PAPS reductase)/FAD synthetase
MTLDLPKPLSLPLSQEDLDKINAHLKQLQPQEILAWGVEYLPGLYQTTAFGLTGLVAIDMLFKLTPNPPPLIFLDTLHHFPETLELVEEVKKKYGQKVYVYKPEGCDTAEDFEKKHGEKLWETNEDLYDYAVKVCKCTSLDWFVIESECRLSRQEGLTKSLVSNLSLQADEQRKEVTVRSYFHWR